MFPKRLDRRLGYSIGLCMAIGGCVDPPRARYVYQDAEFGVIGIPRNTYAGKTDYQAEAEELMARHFPEGYEILRAEEVIEGQTTREFTKKTEIDADPNFVARSERIKLGKLARSTSYDEKNQLQLRECRIIYRRKSAGTPSRSGEFALAASPGPRFYVDPNEALRHSPAAPSLAKSGAVSQPASGSDVKRVPRPSLN
jgi:hypothetical protein